MARLYVLEDFSAAPHTAAQVGTQDRLAAYEEGYAAGWDDAVKAETNAQSRIGADFAKSLQDMSFTYHEARAHVLSAVGPLLEMMAEQVLPEMAQQGFAQTVLEEARKAIDHAADTPLEIIINPENRASVEALLGDDPALPLTVSDEPSLGPGQAYLRTGSHESQIDIGAVTQGIRDAVQGFLGAQDTMRYQNGSS
ncbi:flagellar biosynthesis protein [Actibacterium sp. XHP0104]|uniref:FliH/SctL family protein n=1 Tax=Actibacterium sp. XHP0104 TaxID=2984335 RepID=UPI0021E8BE06|nr:flagellar biosynthesis protein [Actibacterium sp. XHP0104]MCV2881819.1 flagellar biosynthesis protein [Actibacterium sp. XHP0104]